MLRKMNIAVIGTGYVGLVTGTCFANFGHDVICVDVIEEKINKINKGIPPIFEEGLESMLKDALYHAYLTATMDMTMAIQNSELIFICVGTPSKEDGSYDYIYLKEVAKKIGEELKKVDDYKVIVVKSTCSPGTTMNLVKPILEETSQKKAGKDFGLGMNPEFLREGVAIRDFMNPDRIVIGGLDEKSEKIIAQPYSGIDSPILFVDPTTAEMIKIASNSFLAMKVSFINEIANIAEKIGCDIIDIAKGIGMDDRISSRFLRAGLGYGGSCFPKDIKALHRQSVEMGVPSDLLEATMKVNDAQPLRAAEILVEEMEDRSLEGKKIGILGLAFKPDTDDVREAVSLVLIDYLLNKGAKVVATDPKAIKNFREEMEHDNLILTSKVEDVLTDSDACILVTEWKEYLDLAPDLFKELMKIPLVIDGRRCLDFDKFIEKGVKFRSIGLRK
jgi:UDPglucose 6-dehydrogenase